VGKLTAGVWLAGKYITRSPTAVNVDLKRGVLNRMIKHWIAKIVIPLQLISLVSVV